MLYEKVGKHGTQNRGRCQVAPRGGGGGVSESMDGWGCATLAFEVGPKNLIFI